MAFMRIARGERIVAGGCEAIITHVVSSDQVIVRNLKTGAVQQISIRDIERGAAVASEQRRDIDLSLISKDEWAVAQMRYEAIMPLLKATRPDIDLVKEIAGRMGRHPATIYRWLKRFEQERQQSALIPAKRGVEPGHSRLRPEVEAIIQAAINERYLQRNRIRATQLHVDVVLKCRSAGLLTPHVNTVRNRISDITQRISVASRLGKAAARQQFEPIKGHFPGANGPLSIVQIDHTKLDVIVVDEVNRKPLSRPWLSVAIDVFSRMVVGFYLSLEAPSAASTGMCVARAILPKDAYLSRWEIKTSWPVWGRMAAIHCDNGKDFRGAMFRQACQQYGIELLFRPVRQPHYGGHIERLMGTFASEIHTLPGTTFSNPRERQDYDSEKHSALTLSELELWMTRYIVEIYHQRSHSGLDDRVPLKVYEEGILKSNLPELCTNEQKLRLDFMPLEQRAVTVNGIVVDTIAYFHDVLRPWIHAKDKNGRQRRFVVRRDPRDISVVHFFDPELKQYFAIPYRDSSHPAISVWELREVRRRLREQGRASAKEDVIFRAYEQMREMEAIAVNKTKQMRRNIERRNSRPVADSARSVIAGNTALWEEDVQPFRELVMADGSSE